MKLVDVTPNDSTIPVFVEQLTELEQTKRNQDLEAELTAQNADREAMTTARASALAKLAALGLTAEEIAAL
jgi:DNA-binding NarL/FixJ family response regulator